MKVLSTPEYEAYRKRCYELWDMRAKVIDPERYRQREIPVADLVFSTDITSTKYYGSAPTTIEADGLVFTFDPVEGWYYLPGGLATLYIEGTDDIRTHEDIWYCEITPDIPQRSST